MHDVHEPLPVPLPFLLLFGIFPVIGVVVLSSMLATGGPGLFGVVWFTIFGGVPAVALVAILRGRGRAGFAVSSVGLHGAADREDAVVPWDEVTALRWEPTGTRVNEQPLAALVADTAHGTVRISTRGGARARYQERVERQLVASGVVPGPLLTDLVAGPALGPGPAAGRSPSPTPAPRTGDPFADIPDQRGDGGPPPPAPDLPRAPPAPSAPDVPARPAPPTWPSDDQRDEDPVWPG